MARAPKYFTVAPGRARAPAGRAPSIRRVGKQLEPLKPILEPTSRAALVTEAIKAAILAGQIAPGEQLVERTLAERLGVSKTPVREALRSLQNSGLLESYPTRGVIVKHVDANFVQDLYEMRLLLEPEAVKSSVKHFDIGLIAQAREKLALSRRLSEANEFAELSRVNRSFHELLYRPCPNQLLKSSLNGMSDQLAFVAAAGWRILPSWDVERREHDEILQYVSGGDADGAREALMDHIRKAMERLVAHVQQ